MAVQGKKGKLSARDRKKMRIRKRILGSKDSPRLSVFRSARHTYAQVVSDVGGATLVQASTLEKEVLDEVEKLAAASAPKEEKKDKEGKKDSKPLPPRARSSKSVLAAMAVGAVIGRRCKEKNITTVVFDRNGFIYHGRVAAVAQGARKAGLSF